MNPTLRKFMELAEEANIAKGTLASQEKFMRLVQNETDITNLQRVTRGLDPVARMKVGDLITFSYRAKYADELAFWDRFPLVIVTSIHEDGWSGINVHYLHPRMRARMLYEQHQHNTPVIEQELANLCVKRYLVKNVLSRPREFPEDYFDVAIQLPFENFTKRSKNMVWSDTSRKKSR